MKTLGLSPLAALAPGVVMLGSRWRSPAVPRHGQRHLGALALGAADGRRAAAAGHPGVDRLGQPLAVAAAPRPGRSPGRGPARRPTPGVRLDLGEQRDDLGAGPLRRVDRRLARRREQGAQVIVELAVPDGDRLDGDPVLGLDLLLDQPHPGREASCPAVDRARRPAVEQPGPQLALLRPGQLDDLLRIVRAALDQGQGLQHRVMHPRGHLGPLLGPDPGLALDHRSRAMRSHHGPSSPTIASDDQRHADQRQQQRGGALVPGQQQGQADDQQQDAGPSRAARSGTAFVRRARRPRSPTAAAGPAAAWWLARPRGHFSRSAPGR